MGCNWSAYGPLGGVQFAGSQESFVFPSPASTYFGVSGHVNTAFFCAASGIATPTLYYTSGTATTGTSAVCTPVDFNQPTQTVNCPVEVSKITGQVNIQFSSLAPNGESQTYAGVGGVYFSVFQGPTPTAGTTVYTTYTAFSTSTITNYDSTVTVPPASCTETPAKKAKRAVCNNDLVLRALSSNAASASQFCSTYTLSSATPGYPYPNYVTSWSTTSSRISSACSCFQTAAPPATTVVNAKGCNGDQVLRNLRVNQNEAATFCSTFTQSAATPGQAYPTYASTWSSEPARISSACSCFIGLPIAITGPYTGPIAGFLSGSTVSVTSVTGTNYDFQYLPVTTTTGTECPITTL